MIQGEMESLSMYVQPALDSDVILTVRRLQTHCQNRAMSEAERETWFEDWCVDVEDVGVPFDLLDKAAKTWRRGNTPFMPTAGQLFNLIDGELKMRQSLRDRAVEYLELIA